MEYYAHTATLPDGKPDLNEVRWRRSFAQLRHVGQMAKEFAAGENEEAPSGLSARGRVKKAQLSALYKYYRNFDQSAIAFRGVRRSSITQTLKQS